MKLVRWREGAMLNVNPVEALNLIASMCDQLSTGKINDARREFTTVEGGYFSIAVENTDAVLAYERTTRDLGAVQEHRKWIERWNEKWRKREMKKYRRKGRKKNASR